MRAGATQARQAYVSALGWWIEAGVDTLVEDNPRRWLEAPLPPAPAPAPAPAPDVIASAKIPAALVDTPLPTTLPELHGWLATTDALPDDPPRGQRLAPSGDPTAGLMIVIDMPEDGDVEAGALLQGEAGLLFDRMLAAIGRSRESIYLAPLAPGRVPGGRLGPAASRRFGEIMRHHVGLVRPRALLVMGDDAAFPLLAARVPAARGGLHDLKLDGRTVAAIATFHPRFLLRNPARKAEAWADLRMLMGALRP